MAATTAPTVTVGARVPREMRDELDRVAKATGRNRNTLVEEALRRFIEAEKWQLADIEAGLREADAGDFATDKEMQTLWSKYEAGEQHEG
jgi:RHH-type transcriptional regulator, rel operon repressor / antitoxin RelB